MLELIHFLNIFHPAPKTIIFEGRKCLINHTVIECFLLHKPSGDTILQSMVSGSGLVFRLIVKVSPLYYHTQRSLQGFNNNNRVVSTHGNRKPKRKWILAALLPISSINADKIKTFPFSNYTNNNLYETRNPGRGDIFVASGFSHWFSELNINRFWRYCCPFFCNNADKIF